MPKIFHCTACGKYSKGADVVVKVDTGVKFNNADELYLSDGDLDAFSSLFYAAVNPEPPYSCWSCGEAEAEVVDITQETCPTHYWVSHNNGRKCQLCGKYQRREERFVDVA